MCSFIRTISMATYLSWNRFGANSWLYRGQYVFFLEFSLENPQVILVLNIDATPHKTGHNDFRGYKEKESWLVDVVGFV